MIRIVSVEDSKKTIHYEPTQSFNGTIEILEFGNVIYSDRLLLEAGITYWTSWASGFYDKTVRFTNKRGQTIEFFIEGTYRLAPDFSPIIFQDRTELCDIFDKHGSDKASNKSENSAGHNYSRAYYHYFKDRKLDDLKIFELGLGTNNEDVQSNMKSHGKPGASLFSWAEFFPNANVFGADIDSRVLFQTDRIRTFYCDQTNRDVIGLLWDNKYLDFEFDLIVEDGLHEFQANLTFLENSLHKLKVGGHYFAEDIFIDFYADWAIELEKLRSRFPDYEFEFLPLYCEYNRHDNNLIHCFRKK